MKSVLAFVTIVLAGCTAKPAAVAADTQEAAIAAASRAAVSDTDAATRDSAAVP